MYSVFPLYLPIRCVIATEDIAEGEVIFTETPIMTGPKLNSGYICLGCYSSLSSPHPPRCSRYVEMVTNNERNIYYTYYS